MRRNQARLLALACVGLFLFASIRMLLRPLHDPDLWWHLASGRWMFQHHHLLQQDIFSFTHGNEPWVNFEWLSQLLMYAVYAAWQEAGLYLAKILFSLTAVAGLCAVAYQSGARRMGWWLSAWMSCGLLLPRLFERAELLSLNLFPVLIGLLLLGRRSSGNKTLLHVMIFLLTVVWVNGHGGVIYALIFSFFLLLGARWARLEKEQVGFYDRAFVVVLLSCLVNPYGGSIVISWLEPAFQLKSGVLINEWKQGSFEALPLYWMFLAVVAGVLILGLLKRWNEVRFWAPALVVFCFVSAAAYRNSVLLAFVGVPFLVEVGNARWPSRWPGHKLAAAASLLFAGYFLARAQPWPTSWLYPNRFPVQAADFLQEESFSGRLYNSYGFGGYLGWRLGPEQKIFQDGRYLFYDLLQEMEEVERHTKQDARTDWYAAFWAKHGIDFAVVDSAGPSYHVPLIPFALRPTNLMFPRADWALVFWDDTALIFLRRTPAYEPFIKRLEYKALWPYNLDQMETLLRAKQVSLSAAQKELTQHEQKWGPTFSGERMKELLGRFE